MLEHDWDFFLAHAGTDGEYATALYDRMESGARVFLDSRCIELGDDWDLTLARAQRRSLVTVVLVSAHTEAAYYQREEIAAAIAMARRNGDTHRVVPVFIGDGALDMAPYGLRLKHGLSTSGSPESLDGVARALLSLGRRLREQNEKTYDGGTEPAPAPTGRPRYYCYISHDKVDQLYEPTGGGAAVTEVPDIPYGRPDVYQSHGQTKRIYAARLRELLQRIGSTIRPYGAAKSEAGESALYSYRGSFVATDIDQKYLIAELTSRDVSPALTLYCSLKYFSHLTVQEGKPSFQSTNYAFFEKNVALTFDTVFVRLSASAEQVVGSPLYLALEMIPNVAL